MYADSTQIYRIATGVAETSTSESVWIVVLLIGFVLVSNVFLITQWKDSKLSKTPNSNLQLIVRADASQVKSTLLTGSSSLRLNSLSFHQTQLNKEQS